MKKSGLILLAIVAIMASFTQKEEAYKIGDTVADFSLKGTDDSMHSMSDYNNAKGFIIIFTCNHCPYSVAYEDRINALYDTYDTMGYHVIAINPNDPNLYESDNFDNMKKRAKEKGFKFPYLVDEGQKLFPKFGATKTPHTYLLDQNKVLRYIGAIDNSTDEEEVSEKYLENAIKALIKGQTPNPATTKAIGCSIKVAK